MIGPFEHFDFYYDPYEKTAKIIDMTARGKVTIEILGLNRKLLLSDRSDYVRKLCAFAIEAAVGGEGHTLFNESISSTEPYSAFARQLYSELPVT